MKAVQKILVVAPHAFGYTDHILGTLAKQPNVEANILYLDRPVFQYKNKLHKLKNFFLKLLLKKNLKKTFVEDRICDAVKILGEQDQLFIIRPDVLTDKTLRVLRKNALRFIAYYYDSTRRFPRKVAIQNFFDKVYSYDREDVTTYGYELLTNYIFDESISNDEVFQFFNISTYDYRYQALERIAKYIQNNDWTAKMQVFSTDMLHSQYLEIIDKHKSIDEVGALIKKSKILVEIQRTEQVGLSFRVFEALGHRKKLITTNSDIVNYDFYHPQNILVIDANALAIPESFVVSPYVEIDEKILEPYRIENWVKKVFELS